jgi:hypothetical protein
VHQVGCKISILYPDARSKIHQNTSIYIYIYIYKVSFKGVATNSESVTLDLNITGEQ